jgi:hypothetical protein
MKLFRTIFLFSFAMLMASAVYGQERRAPSRPEPVRKAPKEVHKTDQRRETVRSDDRRQDEDKRSRRSVNRQGHVETGTVRQVERRRTPHR